MENSNKSDGLRVVESFPHGQLFELNGLCFGEKKGRLFKLGNAKSYAKSPRAIWWPFPI